MDEISSNIVVERSVATEATGLLFQHFISLCHNEGPWKCQMRLHSNWHLKVVQYRVSVPGVDDGEEKEMGSCRLWGGCPCPRSSLRWHCTQPTYTSTCRGEVAPLIPRHP